VPEDLAPGVYIEEIPLAPHPIEGVSTSTAGFVGEALAGPLGEAVMMASFGDFEREFGGLDTGAELGYAVMQFFTNGGQRAWVVRVGGRHEVGDGLAALDGLDPAVNLVCLPGWSEDEVLEEAVAYCDLRRAFLVADPPGSDMAAATELAARLAASGSANAAVYFPPVSVGDPLNGGRPRSSAPSGSVAGVIARTDIERGVFHPPAGVEARLVGVTGLEVQLTEDDARSLAESGVNAIRSFPQGGIVVWGGRTVASGSSEWKYVNIRRLALYLEHSLSDGLQWAVFEPNDVALWMQVRQSVSGFLSGVWHGGGLQGQTSDEAFFVRCDRGVMTQNDIDNGRLVCLIGVAPVRPAEFVLFRIGIQTGATPTDRPAPHPWPPDARPSWP